MLGHEDVRHPHVLGAGAGQAHDVPAVLDDLVVGSRQDEVPHIRRSHGRAIAVRHHPAEDDPLGVVGARRVRPLPGEAEAPVDRDGTTERGVGRGEPDVGVLAVDLLLQPGVRDRDLPRVDADDPGDPARRRVVRRHRHDPLHEVIRVSLVATAVLGLQQPHAAGGPQDLDRAVGDPAQLVARDGLGAQLLRVLEDVTGRLVHGEVAPSRWWWWWWARPFGPQTATVSRWWSGLARPWPGSPRRPGRRRRTRSGSSRRSRAAAARRCRW